MSWQDRRSWDVTADDVYAQRINATGQRDWPDDVAVAMPSSSRSLFHRVETALEQGTGSARHGRMMSLWPPLRKPLEGSK